MKVSIVFSVYNEQTNLPLIWEDLQNYNENLNHSFELIWVNDGSEDNSLKILQDIAENNEHSKFENIIVNFSKNFGHEAAMIAGIDHSTGDCVICMDADRQHPVAEITNMISRFHEGFDIVNMVRSNAPQESGLFYGLLNMLSEQKFEKNASDFFLISGQVASVLKESYRERNRFLRGYVQSMGFRTCHLEYNSPDRVHGNSKYSNKKLFRLAGIAIFSFSNKPLRIVLWVSLIFILFSAILGFYSLYIFFFGEKPPSGYTTQILFMAICFAILFFLLGIQSIYFSKSIEEIRSRPIYIVKEIIKQTG
ncbi:MAG: glycosyltransferase family 2 protein [Flavobacteriales bacterium]|nr:glycosyltransferase family 2 protein [Flavobacteriales bacterium]